MRISDCRRGIFTFGRLNGLSPGRRVPMVTVEQVEGRLMLSASLSSSGLLAVAGTAGVDVIVVSLASGKVQVKQGSSVVGSFLPTAVKQISVNGLGGNDALQVLDNILVPVTLNGGEGDDFLRGGGGKDVLNGDNGNDVLDGGVNADTLNGGAGTDTADYSARTSAVAISLDGIANDGSGLGLEKDNVKPDVENILGGAGNDVLTGNAGANLLAGNGGTDKIIGGAGRDALIGGTGADVLQADADDDLLVGSSTLYDKKIPFLRTLGYEWRRTDLTYTQRIARLKSGASGVKIDSVNVPTDLAADTYVGGFGQDWLVGHWGDVLKDKATTETSTLLSSPLRFVTQARSVQSWASYGPPEGWPIQTQRATNFLPFAGHVQSDFVDYEQLQGADAEASQNSSLTDKSIAAASRVSAGSSDAYAESASDFRVSFLLDETRKFSFTFTRSFEWRTNYELGYFKVNLQREGSAALVNFVDLADQTTPTRTTAINGLLLPGKYTMTVTVSTSATHDSSYAEGLLSAILTTIPAGG